MSTTSYTGRDEKGNPIPTEQIQRDFFINGINWFGTSEEGLFNSAKNITVHLYTLNSHMETLNLETKKLNENILKASKSSDKLSGAVYILTFVVVLMSLVYVGFEVYKYFHPMP